MKKVMKKSLCALLALAMVCTGLVLPGTEARAATNVSYIDDKGAPQTCEDYTVLDGSMTTLTLSAEWYVVRGNVTISERIKFVDTSSAVVNIILEDGCTLTASEGIGFTRNSQELKIYGQSGGSGKLIAKGTGGNAAIGGTYNAGNFYNASITINGGIINATASGSGAGIGAGYGSCVGAITINGGKVTAIAGNGNKVGSSTVDGEGGGAGIGSAAGTGTSTTGYSGDITINGGTVEATGGPGGAGIGGGYRTKVPSIAINGGKITATGGAIRTQSTEVTTTKGSYGAGIGGGAGLTSSNTTVTINGGIITAIGGKHPDVEDDRASGIGNHYAINDKGVAMNLTINGGIIYATSIDEKAKGSQDSWSGVVFDGSAGQVYGNTTITENISLAVPSEITSSGAGISKYTLDVPGDSTLTVEGITIPSGGTLNVGTKESPDAKLVLNGGSVSSDGTVEVYGDVEGSISGTVKYHYKVEPKINFVNATYGTTPGEQVIDIANTGIDSVTISGVGHDNETNFTLTEGEGGELASKASNKNFKLQPKEGLSAGSYEDTVTVTYKVANSDTPRTATAEVSLEVEKAEADVTPTEGTISYDYGDEGGITLEVTVAPQKTAGVALASAAANQVLFDFPKGEDRIETLPTGEGTATVKIEANEVKNYFNAGSGNTVTVSYGGSINLEGKDDTEIKVTVNPKKLNFEFTPESRAYEEGNTSVEGNLQRTTSLVDGDAVTAEYTAEMNDANAGNGKTVNVTVTLEGDDAGYYEVVDPADVKVNISKADARVTTPPVGQNITYDGSDHALVTAGEAEGGELQYSLTNGEDYSPTIPTGSAAQEYTVYYKVVGDSNHNDTEAQSVTATISKAASSVTNPPTAINPTYSGSAQVLVTKGEATGGTLKYALGDTQPGEESFTETIPAETNAGTYYVWYKVVGDKDHEDTEPVKVTAEIKKAASNVTVENVAEATYGDKIELTATVTSGEIEAEKLGGTVQFKVGGVELGEAVSVDTSSGKATLTIKNTDGELQKKLFGETGTTSVTAEYEGNSNIAGDTSEEKSVTVNKRTLTFSFTAAPRAYDQTVNVTGSFKLNGLVDEDNVEVSTYTATVESADVGEDKAVTAEVTTLGGDDAKYYDVGDVNGGTVNITPAVLELTVTPVSITYGTKLTDGLLSGSSAKISGTDKVVTGSWKWASEAQDAMPTVGDGGSKTYKVVFTPSTDKAENFTEASLSTEITVSVGKATPTVTVDSVNGTYGENIVITAKVEVSGVEASDITGTVTFEAGGTPLGQADVENGKATLTVKGNEQLKQHALFGTEGSSTVTATYSGDGNITSGNGSGSATVARRALTYEVTATGREYNGEKTVEVQLQPENLVSGDNVTLSATGTLESANAKTYETVDLSSISKSGGDEKYYSVDETAEGVTVKDGVTISQRVVELTWKLDEESEFTIDYTGGEHTVTATVSNKALEGDEVDVTVEVKPTSGGEGPYTANATNAGEYTATATELTGEAKDNYKLADPKPTKEITINKIGAEFTAPTAKDLTYNGSSQALVNEGSTDDGTMMYALGENDKTAPDTVFDTGLSEGVDAGTYYVWYYVAGDGNHNDSAKACVEVTIKKAVVSFEEHNGETTYDTKPHQVTLTNTAGGAPELTEDDYTVHYAETGKGFDEGDMDETKAGTYDVWVQLTTETFNNYQFEDTKQTYKVGTLTVKKAELELTVNDVTITYGDALANELLNGSMAKITGEGGATITGTWAWESAGTFPAVSDSKSTNYKVTFTPDPQFAGNFVEATLSKEVTITVNKKELTPVVVESSVSDKIYDGNTSVTGGELEFEDMELFNSEPFNGTKPTISGTFAFTSKDAGTNTVNVTGIKFETNGDNYSLSKTTIEGAAVEGSIQQKEVSLTWALDGESELTTGYDTTAHAVTATATTGVEGETVNVTVENGTQTNAGTYTAKAAELTDTETGRAGNYKLPSVVTQEYSITPAEVSFTIENEAKADWASYHETNDDPNPEGYKLTGEGTDYVLEMVYDSFYHTVEVKQTAGEAVTIEKKAENGYCVTYKRVKDAEGKDVTEDAIEAVRNAGTYEIYVTINPVSSSEDVRNYVFSGHEGETSLKIGTITVNPYEITVAWTHLSYVYHGHAMHPNITVLNAFKNDLYTGTSLPTDFDPDTYKGNRVIAFGATGGSDVGEYTVTAKLYGANAGNYTVTDPDETVNIVPAPVTFTVGDNIWVIDNGTVDRTSVALRPTWGAVTTDPDTAVHDSYPKPGTAVKSELNTTIVYKKDGVEYTTAPTEAGTYEVWVEIGNKNFRHSATSDGASHNVGELIITSDRNSVRSYTVTFDPDCEGATGPEAMTGVFANQTVVMPAIGVEREGHIFQGWSYGGRVYMPNEEFHMPSSDVTFKAQWLDTEDIRSVGGTVKQEREDDPTKSDPVLGATVTLKQGSNEIGETVTDDEGNFSFENLVPGIYNLEVRYHNGDVEVVKTYLVDVEGDSSLEGEYVLPGGALNTVVEADVTAVVDMESIVEEADDGGIYTSDDAETVNEGGSVEFKMTVKGTEATPEQIEEIPVPEERIGMVLDMELTKTVTDTSGTKTESDIEDTKTPITTVIHLSPELQGKSSYTIYRFHDLGDGNDMQTITTSENENGEYLKVIREGTAIELHARLYSTYVLTWAQRSGGGGGSAGLEVTLPESVVGGKVSADRPTANPGDRVTLTLAANEGFAAGEVHVYTASGVEVEVTVNDDGTYSFTMPNEAVVVTVGFGVDCPKDATCPIWPYTDAAPTQWYHDGVHYVLENGIMDGYGNNIFKPGATLSRAMVAEMLYKMNGRPAVTGDEPFDDVDEGDWYRDAVIWANANGYITGYGDGTFRPETAITREQLATIMLRYERKHSEVDEELVKRVPSLPDAETTGEWYVEGVNWAVAVGIIGGRNVGGTDYLLPASTATRAEAATMVMRWLEKVSTKA